MPRSEYPRPQFVREDWLCLNGKWQFEVDNSKSGKEREFYKRESLNEEILVPFCPESELSGIENKDFMSCVWYRRNIDIPEKYIGKTTILHFGAVDYHSVIYINGEMVGEHKGGYTSFSFDITKYLTYIFTNSYNMTDKMFMGASTKQGLDIANKSREIIRGLIGDDVKDLKPIERDIVERIVHSTADPEYAKLVHISDDFVDVAMKSLRNNETILTDINMVKYGITRYDGEVECYIKNEEVKRIAKEHQITRAAAAIRYASENDFEGIVVSGNAPTAVFEAMDLYQKGEMNLKAIVGVPVGFVGAADSKEALHNSDIPNIIVEGPKGGTPIAVACVNSLIQHL